MNLRHSLPATLSVLVAFALGCSDAKQQTAAHPTAPELMVQYGCPTCHVIPHVPGAVGKVGPSLATLSQRSYIGGTLPNSPATLEFWLMHPQRVHPGSAMPDMDLSEIRSGRNRSRHGVEVAPVDADGLCDTRPNRRPEREARWRSDRSNWPTLGPV